MTKNKIHIEGSSYNDDKRSSLSFTSNWSERHAAFVCGLGTFGLSKGLITKKGVAGRFGSIITELNLSPCKRGYILPIDDKEISKKVVGKTSE